MKTKILVGLFVIIIAAACGKDNYNTTPTITLESTSSKVVPSGGILRVELKVTDKEGDISDTIYVKKTRKNQRVTATIRDSFPFRIPEGPETRNGFVTVDLRYTDHLTSAISPGNPKQNDTLSIQFVVRDKAKNRSEPVIVDNVVIIR
jgi:hypothetical protein